MPHVSIKMISGCSEAQKKAAAEAVAKVINETTGKPTRYISVSVEDYSMGEWKSVYDAEIGGKSDKLYVKPGYTDPVTFS